MKAWWILVTPLDPNEIKREWAEARGTPVGTALYAMGAPVAKEKKLPGSPAYYLDKSEAKRELEKVKRSRKYKRCRIVRVPKSMMKMVKAAEKFKTEQEAKAAAKARLMAELTPEERVKHIIANLKAAGSFVSDEMSELVNQFNNATVMIESYKGTDSDQEKYIKEAKRFWIF